MKYDVEFRYRDDPEDPDPLDMDEVYVQRFDTMAEARAFAAGLTWGDEPLFEVLAIVTVMMP